MSRTPSLDEYDTFYAEILDVDDLKQVLKLLTSKFESELEDLEAHLNQRLKTQMSKFRADEQKRLDQLLL